VEATREPEGVADLVRVLGDLGLEAGAGRDGQADLVLRLADGADLSVEVKALVAPSPTEVASLVVRHGPGRHPVLVADRLVAASRQKLNEAGWGWRDRRGHLRLRYAGLIIDTEIPGFDTGADRARPVLETDVGLDVACALLAHPDERLSVRRTVTITGRSLGAVHAAMSGLRQAGLTDSSGTPVRPSLLRRGQL